VTESQATSAEAGSCCETGEEFLRELGLPLAHQMEQLTRLAKEPLTLRAAELVRRDGPHETMAGRSRVVLLEQLAAHDQRRNLAAQPTQHPPDGAVVQKPPLLLGRTVCRSLVDPPPASRAGRLAIGLSVVLQIACRQGKQAWGGVTLIGKYESRDNR